MKKDQQLPTPPLSLQHPTQDHDQSEQQNCQCRRLEVFGALVVTAGDDHAERLQEPFEPQEWQQVPYEYAEWHRGAGRGSEQQRHQAHQAQQYQQHRHQVQQQQQQDDEDSIEEVVRLHQAQLSQQRGSGNGTGVRRRSAGVQVGGGGTRGFVATVGGVVGQGFLALRRTRVRAGCAS
ncbi:AT-rich binding protein-like [Anopheles cruzii]|uniref:AT-rich binding protein-like n=1 Tax=Anopheles cruzii TaxID=68878 RepID=UPI0022EC8348|nr:AT-rich binding protein-like [Anopheles cruzii]